ncbi:lasso peptide biosynthesis B2 protein [Baekduia soli]|uniref:Lasso peptide biosynthesis B2 protein n=1 Tax=Baekduia soli TaxID=496014 RepID=A0A5B8U170_9ACTN|nr:lasso peptide biosynthesis B2 protein [Baekduia soli]QEC46672.1 lasso peptide biosynthesis B2 protein [Baekduia soli]
MRPGLRRAAAWHGVPAGTVWAWRSLRCLRRDLKRMGLEAAVPPCPPAALTRPGRWSVAGVLRAGRATCLERSLIVQRLLAGAGRTHDVAIGVRGSEGTFRAHAWVVGHDVAPEQERFTVLTRIPPG